MKYHIQEHKYDPKIGQKGSCYPTALACILDLDLHDVPYFHLFYWTTQEKRTLAEVFKQRYLDGKTLEEATEAQRSNFHHWADLSASFWDITLQIWLASRGYREKWITDIDAWLLENPGIPYLASGISERGVDHVVVYMDGKLLHDPYPDGKGLVTLDKTPFSYLQKLA